ncbi:MAG: hypothetical protein KAS32_14220 [Candidatus Peribacteraceae bacterium]|nr:hypothetical protein [Candidatus Peribacteraceae bacterium]
MPVGVTPQQTQTIDTAKISSIDINVDSQRINFSISLGYMNSEEFIVVRRTKVIVRDAAEFQELATSTCDSGKNLYDNISDNAYAWLQANNKL